MFQIDLGNMAFAVSALTGLLFWIVYFGMVMAESKPPAQPPTTLTD